MSFDEQPAEGSKWDIHYHDHSTEHKVRVIAHCKHCARCRFERKNTDCVVLAVAPVADEQPDGDIHGECAAEIHRLELELRIKTEEHDCCAADLIMRRKSAEAAIAENVELRALLGNAADTVSIAMRNAWQLGQTYRKQADSDSYKQNAKAGETYDCFHRLVGETRAEITGRGGM